MNILITGGAGFIGSNFINYFAKKYRNYHIFNLDSLTYAGSLENLREVEREENYTFIKGDICDFDFVREVFLEHKIDSVIHFAAESHVDNSIKNPSVFINTNVNGTFNLLHNAYNAWFVEPFVCKDSARHVFFHISTDEVYGSLEINDEPFTESTSYAPNSPYSASKASSDMLVRSYFHTYGLCGFITNCSNNYGIKQHDEKLIPTIIRNALLNKDIPIYGDGKNIRDWLYVDDHARAIDLVFHSDYFGESFNVGGNCEIQNINIAEYICKALDKLYPKEESYTKQIRFVKDRAGHDRRYAINAYKIQNKLGFIPQESFESGIMKTIQWYAKKYGF